MDLQCVVSLWVPRQARVLVNFDSADAFSKVSKGTRGVLVLLSPFHLFDLIIFFWSFKIWRDTYMVDTWTLQVCHASFTSAFFDLEL